MLFRASYASFVLAVAGLAAVPSVAVQPISRVREIAQVAPNTKVSVRAVVTRFVPGRALYLQDQTGSIFANTRGVEPLVPGDLVETSGIADIDEHAPFIDKAVYLKIGTGEPPKAVGVTAQDLADGRHEAELVTVHGLLVGHRIRGLEAALSILSGDVEFDAWVPRALDGPHRSLQPGTSVLVTGVASMRVEHGKPKEFELLMRTGADAVVLYTPPWWTTRRIGMATGTVGGGVVFLLSYVLLLRRQVARQTAAVRDRLAAEATLAEEYRQAQKLEAVGRLAGGIAHDFNNIMTVVLGHSEILASKLKDQAELQESVGEIQRAAGRAASLTRQLLAFGRRQRLQPAAVDLNEIARDVVLLLSRVLGGEIEVFAQTADTPVRVVADRGQLEQALVNLAVNARDAMPDGGRLTLSVARRPGADGRMAGTLAVTDTGAGIAPEARPHIFDPFFTTKEIGQGSGLGLAMVYGFVQQSGGTVEARSTVGVGTTFELTFPLAPATDRSPGGAC